MKEFADQEIAINWKCNIPYLPPGTPRIKSWCYGCKTYCNHKKSLNPETPGFIGNNKALTCKCEQWPSLR